MINAQFFFCFYCDYMNESLDFSFLGKPVSESDGDSTPEQPQVNTTPPAHSEVIYDDVPCENITQQDAGLCHVQNHLGQ